MKTLWLIFSCLMIWAQPLVADTIYETNSQGNEIVLQRDAIVTRQDSSFVVYKHFDLKERRVTVVRLNRGSLPFRVQVGNTAARAQIVNVWKHFGYKASITDQTGKTTQVYDIYLDFYPPEGRGSLLDSVPARTSFPLLTDMARGQPRLTSTKLTAWKSRESGSASTFAKRKLLPGNSLCRPLSPLKSASWELRITTTPTAPTSLIIPSHFPD